MWVLLHQDERAYRAVTSAATCHSRGRGIVLMNMEPSSGPEPDGSGTAYMVAWRDHRHRVFGVAYRMLGGVSDAEDAVQEAFGRLARANIDEIDDVRGWLITVTTRLCIDELRRSRARRGAYMGPWLPEPIVTGTEPADRSQPDPADLAVLDESISVALLVVFEQLSPAERVVFVLHDVFGFTFDEIAVTVGRTPAACRQLASRARRHVEDHQRGARVTVTRPEQRALAQRFADACATGALDALIAVLDPDCVGEFDSGGVIPGAPLDPLFGADPVAAALVFAFHGSEATFDVADVNGEPGVIVQVRDRVAAVIAIDGHDGLVDHIHGIGNPDKLRHLERNRPFE